ncbi:MAG: hypothetical protein ACR2K2_05215 [Mycobacteriales bacterium]
MSDALPNAAYLGFTGTPIESTDRSTRSVFGDYIDVYDLTRAVEDGATVRIYYESRLAKVSLPTEAYDALDALADEITEGRRRARPPGPRPSGPGWRRSSAPGPARHGRGRPGRALVAPTPTGQGDGSSR